LRKERKRDYQCIKRVRLLMKERERERERQGESERAGDIVVCMCISRWLREEGWIYINCQLI
jgi:hypothetical protein